jgi:2-amino-4-hydroxy-6-hydroxymethyldihydropteridine diphosphokinase
MSGLWVPAYIGIGSNLDDPAKQVSAAITLLAQLDDSRLVAQSGLYQSSPLGPQDQPDFVNAAAGILTRLSAAQLLAKLKQLETHIGRQQPVQRWGPRLIDFDLLVYGNERISTPDLTVPHPGVPVRNFVLYPLLDISPDLLIPGHGWVRTLAAQLAPDGLTRLN